MPTLGGPKRERSKKGQAKVLPEAGWRLFSDCVLCRRIFLTAEVVAPQVELREVAQLTELCRYWAW